MWNYDPLSQIFISFQKATIPFSLANIYPYTHMWQTSSLKIDPKHWQSFIPFFSHLPDFVHAGLTPYHTVHVPVLFVWKPTQLRFQGGWLLGTETYKIVKISLFFRDFYYSAHSKNWQTPSTPTSLPPPESRVTHTHRYYPFPCFLPVDDSDGGCTRLYDVVKKWTKKRNTI